MRILLLNQFIPPATPPTARLLGDLADALREAGHDVACIGATRGYETVRGVRRVLRDATAHLKISWSVLTAGRCDWIICFSDPTGLPFTASFLARLKRARLAHWAMDVYPQVAIALEAMQDGIVAKSVGTAMSIGYRGCDLLVGLDADMAKEINRVSQQEVRILPPWPPTIDPANESLKVTTERRCWLYSGNLGRAHDFSTLLQAQKKIEDEGLPWSLHFQGGGPCREAAMSMAEALGVQHCHWSGYADDDKLVQSLLAADVLIATQLPATRGLLWPSKLALMQQLDLPVLWIGPLEGQIAKDLKTAGSDAGVFGNGDSDAIVSWLRSVPAKPATLAYELIQQRVETLRRQGIHQWLSWLRLS